MESSEDDAGTATNASRRASAREKDVGLAEDVNATSSFHQEPSEARPSCETPAMSEDNFDGDSVPSPSAQDVNTSTEAILDMIDEIVDGPGAPKRLPLSSEDDNMQFDELEITSVHSNNTQESTKSDSDNISPLPVVASPAESVNKSEPVLPIGTDSQAESSITSDISAGIANTDSVDPLPESSSLPEGDEPAVSTQPEDSELSSVVPESPAICPLPIPSSSEEQTVQNISDVSECETQERTVKCVTSSDSRDNVTVESAESTSSDSSVSEGKAVLVEPQVRSPLRRRLVRPAPSDRRPDSTVSSTVDSQIVNLPVVEETGSESITKDVTSSSDAVPTIHGNVKPEEIRNVSEINFCKAETSVSPPKKIKLIRQKVNTGTSNRNTSVDKLPISSEKDQCQSTSSESHSLPLPETITESSSTVSISKSQENNESIISISNCVIDKPEKSPEQAVCSDQHSQPSIEHSHSPKEEKSEKESNNEQEVPAQSSSCQPHSPISEANAESGNIAHENSNLTNLPAPSSAVQIDVKLNVVEQDCASNIDDEKQEVTKDPESSETVQIPSEISVTESSICPESSQISSSDSCKPDNSSTLEKDDQNDVPPSEPNSSTSNLPESKVEEEQSSTVSPIELSLSTKTLSDSNEEAEQSSIVSPVEPNLSTTTLPKSKEEKEEEAEKTTPLSTGNQNMAISYLPESKLEAEQSHIDSTVEPNSSMTNLPEAMEADETSIVSPNEPNLTTTNLPKPEVEAEQSSIVSPMESSLSTTTLPESNEEAEQSTVVSPIEPNLSTTDLPEAITEAEQTNIVPSIVPNSSTPNLPDSKVETEKSSEVSPIELDLSTTNLPEAYIEAEQTSIVSAIEPNLPESKVEVQQSSIESPMLPSLSTTTLPESKEETEQSNVIMPCKQNLETPNIHESTVDAVQSSLVSPTEPNLPRSNLLEPKVEADQSGVVPQLEPNLSMKELPESTDKVEQSSVGSPCKQKKAISNLPEQKAETQQSGLVPPIKLNLSSLSESKVEAEHSSISKNSLNNDESEAIKQVPKLTIKLKQSDEMKAPVPKLTIKPIKPPTEHEADDKTVKQQNIPSVTKINIKPILKPPENEKSLRSHGVDGNAKSNASEQVPCITKLNIKPIPKPPEKINDIHRKSSSSEISESEYSENDESTSTSDQASASDQGPSDIVPKVTIKLGKPGTESAGKFYTEQNAPKLTIKAIQPDGREESESKLKLIISQSEDTQPEKIPKLTIKTVAKSEGQPLSPRLTIKPIKPPDTTSQENEVSKTKTPAESYSDHREGHHVPKITIKPVTRSSTMCDSPEHIPVVTKINIKPILKPTDIGEPSEGFDEKVPVVSKLNIKPVIKPKDNDVDSSIDEVPKITKLNIKPIKNPDENSSEEKDCDELNADIDKNCIPVVTKINIKPIIKPQEEETLKDSENQSSETGNSSDDNGDHIPVVTKLNIKPIIKPDDLEESSRSVSSSELSIPVVTKLNIKPLIKPSESISPSSPKKEHLKTGSHSPIPVVTKLNIKPVVRPDDAELSTSKDEVEEKSVKNPPLVMKINMKAVTENYNNENLHNEHVCNNVSEGLLSIAPKNMKAANELQTKCENTLDDRTPKKIGVSDKDSLEPVSDHSSASEKPKQNCVPEPNQKREESVDSRSSVIKKPNVNTTAKDKPLSISIAECDSMMPGSLSNETKTDRQVNESHTSQEHKNVNFRSADATSESNMMQIVGRQKYSSVQNCTLLKKLLENKSDSLDKSFEMSSITNCGLPLDKNDSKSKGIGKDTQDSESSSKDKLNSGNIDKVERRSPSMAKVNDSNKTYEPCKSQTIQQLTDKTIENMTKPLEITISDKLTNQSSGQDSPRIILKINKTDHGSSAKIITEEVKRPDTQLNYTENTQDIINDKQSPRKHLANSRRKQAIDTSLNLSTGKRLRSSRIVENTEKSPPAKRNTGKRSTTDMSPPQNKEPELSILQTKRLKLGQLLSNKSLTITSVSKQSPPSPTKTSLDMKQGAKTVNHTLLNNENCSKNGNSKLHNILSNLQAKQMHINNTNCSEKAQTVASDKDLNTSMSGSDAGENTHVENSRPEVQEMIIAENTDFREFGGAPEEVSQDPLEVDSSKPEEPEIIDIPKPVELTPQPKKRGRPRKLPVSEGAKPAAVTLPVPALEERPQRSLRLMRDRPTILSKPRGRGRGRGGRRSEATPPAELETVVVIEPVELPEERPVSGEIDPTSSRIKLPRMTEALDKMPSTCNTPLSSRRRNSSGNFSTGETPEKTENSKLDEFGKSPEPPGSGRGRRGGRGGRGRTPRGRGRGRGGGRGAMYMKETMGIYGRVCGPATTTVQLFEEETCMMDDNATPAKPSHLLDEDSQSSVKSSTNESSNKQKKSKFADLFDSNKVWTAADVKEYTWPPPDKADVEHKVMMIQEQVAMFLGVKSFKRRYAELNRRTITGEERDYVLSKGLVTEALCDLGITAVDASDVLDIMLSDYPHKYEEYRSHQRQRQLTETPEEPAEEVKEEDKAAKVETKPEKPVETKPEPPKVDPEKTRQVSWKDMAAAAIASASEWNARANASRRGACADLQSLTVQRARPAPAPPRAPHLRPPAGFYPHALLPGQYHHAYRVYTPDQLRYFPLNTVLAAPPAPTCEEWSSESEPDWGSRCSSSDDSDVPTHHSAKRKKLTKTKRSSQAEVTIKEEPRDEADLCRVCKMRLEANRRYTHERFLVCANCNAKLHPSCLELSADTIRKCREYAWQCAECKTCCSCRQPADDDKMLFCDLCDRGFHIYCVGLDTVPSGRWHCVECAICKSCGARSPGGSGGASGGASTSGGGASTSGGAAADWHHQTRRGPGGHKVYSHSLCTPCARAYRIGRYCPLCERSFIGPKGTMQLVICKLCDRQLHQDCVRQTVSALNVLDYTCAECRRGGITSRAAAVRLAPRTIATLFMAKRRFNKYAHRQYLQQRQREAALPQPELVLAPATPEPDDVTDASDPLRPSDGVV